MHINAINKRKHICEKLKEIECYGNIDLSGQAVNSQFSGNLIMIDSVMEKILSYMLIEHYKNKISKCCDIATAIGEKNPLHFPKNVSENIYRYKIKEFLCAVALGMMPSKPWNGNSQANGGYIIVKKSGDVLAYHIYDRDNFKTYLLNNTKLDTPSTSRYRFGQVYENSGELFINLNLQIRFI